MLYVRQRVRPLCCKGKEHLNFSLKEESLKGMCYNLRTLLEVSEAQWRLQGESEYQHDTDVKLNSIQAKNYIHWS